MTQYVFVCKDEDDYQRLCDLVLSHTNGEGIPYDPNRFSRWPHQFVPNGEAGSKIYYPAYFRFTDEGKGIFEGWDDSEYKGEYTRRLRKMKLDPNIEVIEL